MDTPSARQLVDDAKSQPSGPVRVWLQDAGQDWRSRIRDGDPKAVAPSLERHRERLVRPDVRVNDAVGDQLADDQGNVVAYLQWLSGQLGEHQAPCLTRRQRATA
ncbi:MAG: hypothetical protein WAK93_19840 [Solirubrobacteraceae bacterium]